jgi:two-component system sensor histidine kinase BaeS
MSGWAAFFALLALFGATAIYVIVRVLTPLKRLVVLVRHVKQDPGQTEKNRVREIGGTKSIQFIAHSVMLDAVQLARQELLRKQLLDDITHEIRTPLASLRANLEGIRDGLLEADHARCNAMMHQIDRLSHMVGDLDESLEGFALSSKLRPIPLQQFVTAIHLQTETLCRSFSLEYEFANRTESNMMLLTDPDRLHQVFLNIISNARKFTPERGGKFALTIDEQPDSISIYCADNGQGISAHDKPYVFERLYKGDMSRSRRPHETGSGLGLSIAKEIIGYHGGTIKVTEPQFKHGCTIIIQLPKPALAS